MKQNYSKHIFSLIVCLFSSAYLFSQNIAVNEVMGSNLNTIQDEDNSPQDWIEIYNYGTESVNLAGFGLTDDASVPYKWVFPSVTLNPSSYLLVWASDKNRIIVGQPLHTNFKISSGGEEITLTNPTGTIVSQSPSISFIQDVSIGRQPDGTGPWLYFYTATPNAPNTGMGLEELLIPPSFSQNSGFFTTAFDLTLSHPNPNAVIIYTLDGSDPDINNLTGTSFQYKNVYPTAVGSTPGPLLTETYTSLQYNTPINIYDRSAEPDKLAAKNTRQHTLYVPTTPVRKGTVLKARSYVDGIPSKVVSRTYFVWADGNPYTFPVLSLQTQESNFFDYDLGTYTAGVDFDTWRANNPTNTQYYRPEWCNYFRKSSAWEYPMSVEIFDNNTSVINLNAGYRIHGNNSRAHQIKSMRLYASSDYDDVDVFQYNLFDNSIYDATNPTNNKYKRILLRGNGSGGPVAYDAVFNRIMQPMYNGVSRIKNVVHFINGEYWGLSAMRDRFDKYHYAYNFNLDKDNIAKVDCEGSNCEIDEGDTADYANYNTLRDYIIANDMSNNTFYAQVASQFEMSSFIDHMVLQIYSGNNGYERKYWKARVPENDTYGDGKWRTTIQDFEPALSTLHDWLEHWGTIVGSPNEALFANLLANTEFKNQFINRFADALNSCFMPAYFAEVVNTTFDEVEPYLAENANRTTVEDFYTPTNKQQLLNWGNNHPAIQRNSIKTFFNINNTIDITLSVSSNEAGTVKINTIDIDANTPGITENPYPWTGIYFENIPVTVKAKANPGFVFSHWSGDVSSTDTEITFTPTANTQIQANFTQEVATQELVYFWFMGGQIPNDTPLEFLDATYSSNALTASLQYDSCLVGYPFTNTDTQWRTASMERRNAPTALNYFEVGNNNLPYNSSAMKGIQIKQPFRDGSLENTLRMLIPTTDLEQIKISFAVESDGAAHTIIFDYWDGTNWTNAGIANPSVSIGVGYQVIEIDLSQVSAANNQAAFQFRMRFDGDNMFVSEGKRVQFNNIAVEAQEYLSTPSITQDLKLKAYPNPAQTLINIQSSQQISHLDIYNIYGQKVRQLAPEGSSFSIDIQDLPVGIYILRASSESTKEKTIKIIKN